MNRITTTEAADRVFVSTTTLVDAFNQGTPTGETVGGTKKIRLDPAPVDQFGIDFHRKHALNSSVNRKRIFHIAAHEAIRLRVENETLRAQMARQAAQADASALHAEPVPVIDTIPATKPVSILRRLLGQ